jgi:hypothetical protein
MKNSCARDCPERSVGCHISCKRYKAYREYLDEKNAQIRHNECFVAYIHDRTEKTKAITLKKQQKGRRAND